MVMWMIQYNVLDTLCCDSFSLTMGNLNMSGKGVSQVTVSGKDTFYVLVIGAGVVKDLTWYTV